ncbi:MAG: translation elongation factor Ts [Planctomycetota bacterium]
MAEISADLVKKLREMTGAGFMECKQALVATGGDLEKAAELNRKKGVEAAGKKASRATKEGWIGHYIHANGKIAVLVEVGCETDFVARNDQFQEFIRDLAMHVAATNPKSLAPEDLDPAIVAKERELIAESDEVKNKPVQVRDKIIEGKMKRFFSEVCFLEQPFVKDDKVTIRELLSSKIAKIGENMSIRRFVRFELGS